MPTLVPTGEVSLRYESFTGEIMQVVLDLSGELLGRLVKNGRVGDIVIMGYFESVDAGSAAKRIALGFGSGAADLKTMVEGYLMTETGLRRPGSGKVESGTDKAPGLAVPLVMAAATGNPIALIVSGAVKSEGEMSGRTTIEGAAKQTADEIAGQLKVAFQKQGWI